MSCYCGSGIEKELCCLRFIRESALAKTPQELMRSRYSAYVLGDGRYLVDTTLQQNRYEDDVALISEYAKNIQWLKLQILKSWERGSRGFVEFKAYYRENSKIQLHHEKSSFLKIDGVWFYEKGELLQTAIGRNEPCPCSSGKKFKKCCIILLKI
jgi:SEC-C motif-containing protein